MTPPDDPLTLFHPAIAQWFRSRFPLGPSEPQLAGWPAIAQGSDTLIAAPTGTGKTLSAFLVAIDELYRSFDREELDDDTTRIVYVSPLKALAVDIEHNLKEPLGAIAAVAHSLGKKVPDLRVAVRNGDTTAGDRARLVQRPPHILITTPESLYLMVTAERTRERLRGVRTIVVDEIHALARDKRGSHLALTLERLAHLTPQRPVRIGLSATQRPLDKVARLLVGTGIDRSLPDGSPRCAIVDVGHRREIDLDIELPESELEAVAPMEQVGEVMDRIAAHVRTRRTTLIFVNTRRLAERVAHMLGERLGDEHVASHHGSLSKERRLRVERQLRAGELRALVATASLELGIDIGPVELVCQLGTPRSIATFLQRAGRSGHQRFATPVAKLYPLTRDELVECAALLRAVRRGNLDALFPPRAPLDILAQQIVAECSAEAWNEDALFALFRGAAPYETLSRADFDAIVELVSEGVSTGRGRRAAYVHRDRVHRTLRGRRGARLAALTSGGAIPESADYRVVADPDDTFVGTVNEDFAIESMVGDVFLLGSTSWRIRRVEPGVVRVVDAQGATATIPFWLGEAPARTVELSAEVGALRSDIERRLDDTSDATSWTREECGVDEVVARAVVQYLKTGRDELGVLPSQRDVVVERFFDETGGMQLVVHAPFGGRINRALGLLLRKRFCTSFDFELQAAANDDAIVLSLGPQHSFPLEEARGFLSGRGVRQALERAVLPTPMFQIRWRWNLNRALLVLRFKGGRKNPPPIQRMEADDLMVALFPSLAACQDNATGPREIPDEAIVRQTLHDCLHEAMDLEGLASLLDRIESNEVRMHFRDTTEPSVLSHEILNARPYAFLDDAPLEERRTRAVQLRRGLPVEARELAGLDPRAIARVRQEAALEARDASEFHDLLMTLGVVRPILRYNRLFGELVGQGRALAAETSRGTLWLAIEHRRAVEACWKHATFHPDCHSPVDCRPEPDAFVAHALRGHLDQCGPVTVEALSRETAIDESLIRAAVAVLENEGFALRGCFDPELASEQICSRRLLARIHGYTQARLRREIEPVTAQDFMRFLLRWQRAAPGTQLGGRRGVLAVLEQLQGFEASAASWEPAILSARLAGYQSEWLDAACLGGEAVWARFGVRSPNESVRTAALTRATPISLAIRADLPWLLRGFRGVDPAPATGDAAIVVSLLRQRGALFFAELVIESKLPAIQVRDALREAVALGLVTADGFQPLRSLLSSRPRAGYSTSRSRRGLRRGVQSAPASEGRWAAVSPPELTGDRDEIAEAVAEQLVARWGVVFRDIVTREALALPWRDVLWAFRRLEARGVVRGGRFVAGFVGEQYALPGAVDALREVRRRDRDGTVVHLSACDPLNLVGIVTPGPRVAALRTNTVTLRDGVPEPPIEAQLVATK